MVYLTPVYDCCNDLNVCCDVLWCTSCQIGRQYAAVHGLSFTLSLPHCVKGCVCPCIEVPLLRRRISHRYGLKESVFSSCLLGFFCLHCGLCQTSRELTLRQACPGGTCCDPAFVSVVDDGYDCCFLAPNVQTLV